MTQSNSTPNAVGQNGPLMQMPRLLLNAEAAVFFVVAVALYIHLGGSLLLFLLLILAPDLGMLGYLANARLGSIVYDVVHFYLLPVVLISLGLLGASEIAVEVGLIWFAHISMDRIVGYGLKYPTMFKDTHLQHV